MTIVERLDSIENELKGVRSDVAALDKGLAVHKQKTGRFSMFMSAMISLLVAVAGLALKGCL